MTANARGEQATVLIEEKNDIVAVLELRKDKNSVKNTSGVDFCAVLDVARVERKKEGRAFLEVKEIKLKNQTKAGHYAYGYVAVV